jgi:hypothetical protein
MEPETKRCSKCGETKATSAFSLGRTRGDGLQGFCKTCSSARAAKYYHDIKSYPEYKAKAVARAAKYHHDRKDDPEYKAKMAARSRKRKYNITKNQYAEMLAEHDGKCALCGKSFGDGSLKVHIDHDHRTGTVRSLLHAQCNTSLHSIENPNFLLPALAYLERHGCSPLRCYEENIVLPPIEGPKTEPATTGQT